MASLMREGLILDIESGLTTVVYMALVIVAEVVMDGMLMLLIVMFVSEVLSVMVGRGAVLVKLGSVVSVMYRYLEGRVLIPVVRIPVDNPSGYSYHIGRRRPDTHREETS